MKTKLQIAVIFAISFLCGCMVTAWSGWQLYFWMLSKEVWVRPCRDVDINIHRIQKLKDGQVAEVIEMLEMDVDFGLIMLSGYAGDGGDQTRRMVADSLQRARDHRKQNPRVITEPTIRAAVDGVLAK